MFKKGKIILIGMLVAALFLTTGCSKEAPQMETLKRHCILFRLLIQAPIGTR